MSMPYDTARGSVDITQALQHNDSTLNYLSRAVQYGQELDESFPAPAEEFQQAEPVVQPPSPTPVLLPAHADTSFTHRQQPRHQTCLSLSTKYDLVLINQKLKLFVQTAQLQCMELPNFLNRKQTKKVKLLACLYGAEGRNCGRQGLTLFKTAHVGLPDECGLSKITQLLLAEPKSKAGKAQAKSKQHANNSRRKAAAQAGNQHGKRVKEAQHPQTSTEVATLPLDDSNVGNKMLKSMGWSEGTGLGILAQGQVYPVPVITRVKRRGLGA